MIAYARPRGDEPAKIAKGAVDNRNQPGDGKPNLPAKIISATVR